jgi:hypothetical protein
MVTARGSIGQFLADESDAVTVAQESVSSRIVSPAAAATVDGAFADVRPVGELGDRDAAERCSLRS